MLSRYIKTRLDIGKSEYKNVLPQLKAIEKTFGLNLKSNKDFKLAIRLLVKSVLYN
jgi:hypothetical protein